jgi:hypothetical protein
LNSDERRAATFLREMNLGIDQSGSRSFTANVGVFRLPHWPSWDAAEAVRTLASDRRACGFTPAGLEAWGDTGRSTKPWNSSWSETFRTPRIQPGQIPAVLPGNNG